MMANVRLHDADCKKAALFRNQAGEMKSIADLFIGKGARKVIQAFTTERCFDREVEKRNALLYDDYNFKEALKYAVSKHLENTRKDNDSSKKPFDSLSSVVPEQKQSSCALQAESLPVNEKTETEGPNLDVAEHLAKFSNWSTFDPKKTFDYMKFFSVPRFYHGAFKAKSFPGDDSYFPHGPTGSGPNASAGLGHTGFLHLFTVINKSMNKADDKRAFTPLLDSNVSEVERIERNIASKRRVLIILRGLPGSGKSALASQLQGTVFSTDDHFCRGGSYCFNPDDLQEAHAGNKKRTKEALKCGVSPVIVDNTNTRTWEIVPYVVMGVRYNYIIEVLEPNTEWKFNTKKLAQKNQHGVRKEKLDEMLLRYQKSNSVCDELESQVKSALIFRSGSPQQLANKVSPGNKFSNALADQFSTLSMKKDVNLDDMRSFEEGSEDSHNLNREEDLKHPENDISSSKSITERDDFCRNYASADESKSHRTDFELFRASVSKDSTFKNTGEADTQSHLIDNNISEKITSRQKKHFHKPLLPETHNYLGKNWTFPTYDSLCKNAATSENIPERRVPSVHCEFTQTQPTDFVVSYQVDKNFNFDPGYRIITSGMNKFRSKVANSTHSHEPFRSPARIAKFEKSTSTEDVSTDIGRPQKLKHLAECFPHIVAEDLNHFLDLCGGDEEWLMNVLDSDCVYNNPNAKLPSTGNYLSDRESDNTCLKKSNNGFGLMKPYNTELKSGSSDEKLPKPLPETTSSPNPRPYENLHLNLDLGFALQLEELFGSLAPDDLSLPTNRVVEIDFEMAQLLYNRWKNPVSMKSNKVADRESDNTCLKKSNNGFGLMKPYNTELKSGSSDEKLPKPLPETTSSPNPRPYENLHLNLDLGFALQLEELFGSLAPDDLSLPTNRVVEIDFEMAQLLYNRWKNPVSMKSNKVADKEQKSISYSIQELKSKREMTSQIKTGRSEPMPLSQVMDLELALKLYRDEKLKKDGDVSTQLKRLQLHNEFPGANPMVLDEVFESNNFSLESTLLALEEDLYQRELIQHTSNWVTHRTIGCEMKKKGEEISKKVSANGVVNEGNGTANATVGPNHWHHWVYPEAPPQSLPPMQDALIPLEAQEQRDLASKHHARHQEQYRKASAAYQRGMKGAASYYSREALKEKEKFAMAQEKAAKLIFDEKNLFKSPYVIDLHGLVVKEAIFALDAFLRDHKGRLDASTLPGSITITVITGQGNHSMDGRSKLRSAVMQFLNKANYDCRVATTGSIEVCLHVPGKGSSYTPWKG